MSARAMSSGRPFGFSTGAGFGFATGFGFAAAGFAFAFAAGALALAAGAAFAFAGAAGAFGAGAGLIRFSGRGASELSAAADDWRDMKNIPARSATTARPPPMTMRFS